MDSTMSLRIQIPPGVYESSQYKCPCRQSLLNICDPRKHARHVLEDIAPHQCIFDNCTQRSTLLASKSAWLQYLTKVHEAEWQALSLASKCFMCGQSDYTTSEFAKHVAKHLEELAMYILPVLEDEDALDVPTPQEHVIAL